MPIQPVPSMTDTPPFPSLADRAAGTYNSKAYAFGSHMADTFNDELIAVAENVQNNAQVSYDSAGTATAAAGTASSAAGTATAAAGTASSAATTAQNYAAALISTSASSLTIGTGSKTFTTQASKQYAAGQFVLAVSAANSANYMHGQVTSYSGTSLVVNVTDVGGSGTLADWNLSISGTQGTAGSVDATTLASTAHAATSKATPVDADEIPLADSAVSFGLKKLTWANIKATLKSYFDTIYQATLVSGTSIKTVGGNSLLGSGDIAISSGAPLATLTPTAAALVAALNAFSSSYDNYLIIGEGILPATGADDQLCMKLATGGVVDSGSNYYAKQAESGTAVTSASARIVMTLTVYAAGQGCNFVAHVMNVNSASGLKGVAGKAVWHQGNAPQYNMNGFHGAYVANNTVSGVQFEWAGGGNFAAGGKIRIYGYNNT